jgi:hypothetical protein
MNYSKLFFNKDLNDLKEEDIIKYFSEEREETDLIEFKSYNQNTKVDKLFDPVCKAICAFINSQGGIVIFGSPQTNRGKKVQGNLTHINLKFSKDSIVNKISALITPIPNTFSLNIIESPKGDIYVFEIQQSSYSPHQWDNIYWMRIDGQSKAAPHHYIEALFKQVKYPNIEGYLGFGPCDELEYFYKKYLVLTIKIIIANLSPLQNEKNLLYTIRTNLGFFDFLDLQKNQANSDIENSTLFYGAPIVKYHTLYFLKKETYDIKLSFKFGGESSPLKQSNYNLQFPHEASILHREENFNKYLITCKENNLLVDLENDMGITTHSSIENQIGRKKNE